MAGNVSSPERRGGCWHPLIVFIDILIAIPTALWLLSLAPHPWNYLVGAVMLFPLPFYFWDAHKKRATKF